MKGWTQKRIGDLFDVKAGGDLQEANYSPCPTAEAQWPIYANSLENKGLYGYTSKPRFSGNAVTITGRGDIGHAEFRPDDFDAIVRLLVLLPKAEVDCRYITYYINSHVHFPKESTGVPQLTAPKVKRIKIDLPQSKEEQAAIANILSKVDEAITSVQNSIAAAERLKKSLMQNLLTGKMKPDGTIRTSEEFYIDEKFGIVPVGWEVKRIKDFGEVQTGKTPPTDEPAVFSEKENGFMFITPGDLDVAKYIEHTERYVSEKGLRYSYVLPKGTVCEVCIGSTIGKIGITTVECCSNQQITSVIVNNKHDAEYLYYAMLSRREHFKSVAGINATPQINKSGYSKYRVLCPKDKLEQIAIAKSISSVDKRIIEQEQKIKSLERLKKSLMQNLLTGKVICSHSLNINSIFI